MLSVFLLFVFVARVLAGRSPDGVYIDQITNPMGRDFSDLSYYSDNVIEDARLNVTGLVSKYGYPIESHNVVTADGYCLTMHRIPHGRDRNNQLDPQKPKECVILVHGLFSSSADFLVLGPGNAFAYVLAEAGYDVWLMNARGNTYSRCHIRLNPNRHNAFWRFSWEEIGIHDLPACLDHIKTVTGQDRCHYIGHSQGTTVFFVLMSLMPEYANRIKSFHALAPAVMFTNNNNPLLRLFSRLANIFEPLAVALFRGELMPNQAWITWFLTSFCHPGAIFAPFCNMIATWNMSRYYNQTMMVVINSFAPAGGSYRQSGHYSQVINSNNFARYDHGAITNMRLYGRTTPPAFDLSRVTTTCHLHYSAGDSTTHPSDVEDLAKILPNSVLHKLESPYFDHFDYIWGMGVRQTLYDKIIVMMQQADLN